MVGLIEAMWALGLHRVFLIQNYSALLVGDLVTLGHLVLLNLIAFVIRLVFAEHLLVGTTELWLVVVLLRVKIHQLRAEGAIWLGSNDSVLCFITKL